MQSKFAFFIIFICCANAFVASQECPDTGGRKIVCYYGSWAFYRIHDGHFNTGNINPSLCTHVMYSFAGLNIGFGLDSLDPNVDIAHGGYRNATSSLKASNPCLKTILAIGGWNEGSRKYSAMTSTKGAREAFVESVVRLVATYEFDGVDMDWEYPTQRGGIPGDRENFVELLKLLHERLRLWNLEVSIAVPMFADTNMLDSIYHVSEIARWVDHVSLMAYDYTATTSPVTGYLAPLSVIKTSVAFWLSSGLPSEKLILGLPSFARTHRLLDPESHDIGALTNGTGRSGYYTNEGGFLSYYELKSLLDTGDFEISCDEEEATCYAYYDDDWFSFDTTDTIQAKIDYALSDTNLGGLMLWTIDTDDFLGIYGEKYPVLQAINNAVLRNKK